VPLPDGEGGVFLEKICGGEVRQAAGDIDAEQKGGEILAEVKLTTAVLIASNPSTSSVSAVPAVT
jgi:hypothetical protein